MAEAQKATGGRKTSTPGHKTQPVPPIHVIVDSAITGSVTTQPPPESAQKQAEEKPLPWPLRPEWVIVYVTAFYTFFAWRQWQSINRQAELLDQQIKEAKDSNDATAKTAADTLAAIKEQANHMASQAGLLEKQIQAMIADQRPWISFVNAGMEPIVFSTEGRASSRIVYQLRNTGKSPALDVNVRARLIVLAYSPVGIGMEIANEQNSLADFQRAGKSNFMAVSVFPGDMQQPTSYPVEISPEAISSGLAARESGVFAHPGHISMAVIISAIYRVPFGDHIRETRFAFLVGDPLENGAFMCDFKPEGTLSLRLIYFSQQAE